MKLITNKITTCPRCKGVGYVLVKVTKEDGTTDITGTERCSICKASGKVQTETHGKNKRS